MKPGLFSARLGVIAVMLAGCGGGDPLTKEQYVAQLNAMCEDFRAREQKIGEPRTLPDLVRKGPRILEAFETAIVEGVHDLKAPDEIADQAKRLADVADQQRDVFEELVDAASANDVAKVRELSAKNVALNQEASEVASELGAQSCVA